MILSYMWNKIYFALALGEQYFFIPAKQCFIQQTSENIFFDYKHGNDL